MSKSDKVNCPLHSILYEQAQLSQAAIKELSTNPSIIEQSYSMIAAAVSFVTSKLGLVA